MIYILDEPSIGLHQRDNATTTGNAHADARHRATPLFVVEHDEETIRAADHVIDFGPGAGIAGGADRPRGHAKSLEKKSAHR